ARARGARRVRRQDAGAGRRRGPCAAAPGGRRRQRPSVGERALRRDARLLRNGRDVPARGGRGVHPARVSGGGAGGGAGAYCARMTLWQGRVEGKLAPEVWELVKADDAELFPHDCEGTRLHARRLAEAGILSAEELAEVEGRLSELDAS